MGKSSTASLLETPLPNPLPALRCGAREPMAVHVPSCAHPHTPGLEFFFATGAGNGILPVVCPMV